MTATVYGILGESFRQMEDSLMTENGAATIDDLLGVVSRMVALCEALHQADLNKQAADYLRRKL